jgi:hypothetical protein
MRQPADNYASHDAAKWDGHASQMSSEDSADNMTLSTETAEL